MSITLLPIKLNRKNTPLYTLLVLTITLFFCSPHLYAQQPNNIESYEPESGETELYETELGETESHNTHYTHNTPCAVPNSNPINIADHLVQEAHNQLNAITQLLTELSVMIGNKQITSLTNPQEALVAIQKLISLTQSIQKEKCIHANNHTIYALLTINKAILGHIMRMTANGLTSFTPFDLTASLTRAIPTEHISADLIATLFKTNNQTLKTLTQQTDTIGLRWYNNLYRTLDTYIIDPALTYHIPSRVAALAALGSLSAYFYWKFKGPSTGYAQDNHVNHGNNAANNWLPFNVEDPLIGGNRLFGPTLPLSPNGGLALNQPGHAALGWLGKAELEATSLSLGHLCIGGGLSAYVWNSFKHDYAYFSGKAVKKIAMWHNYLKGGAFINRAHKLDDTFIEDVFFDDIIGLDQVKETFKLLVHYLKNPESYDRLGLTPSKGILLVGETRTGKTFSVKALANEIKRMFKESDQKNAQFKYIQFNASEINQEGIKYWLNIVKEVAPCVVFIDEIDLLDLQRRGRNQMLSEFLTSMSGTLESKDPKNQIILIAATNKPESLDIALRQAGRFGTELRYELPSLQNRKELITKRLEKLSLNTEAFDINSLAYQTENRSYEDINAVINMALLKARLAHQILSQDHLERAIDELIRRITVQTDKQISAHENSLLATHFAGHALYLHLTDIPLKMATVTIHPVMTTIKEELIGNHLIQQENTTQDRYQYGELFTQHKGDTLNIYTHKQQLQLCQYHLAGIVAEELVYNSCGHSCHKNDMVHVLKIAQLLAFQGLDPQKLPEHIKKEKYDIAMNIIDECKNAVRELLTAHRKELDALIIQLQEHKQLYPYDIK